MKNPLKLAALCFLLGTFAGCKPDAPETIFRTTIKVVDRDTGKSVPGALVLVGARVSVAPVFEPPYDASMAGNRGFTDKKGEAKFKVVKGLYEGNKPKDALWRVLEARKPKVARKILGVESGSILVFAPGYGIFHQPFGVADNPKFIEYLAKRKEAPEEYGGWFGRGCQAGDYNYKAVLVKAEELKNNREITIKVGKVERAGEEHRFSSFLPVMIAYGDVSTSKESGTTVEEKLDIYAFFKAQLEYAVRVSTDPRYRDGLNEFNSPELLKEVIAWKLNDEENHEKYIHEWLTQKALEALPGEYKEVKEYAQVIQEGVKDEDKGIRSLNHFYNPEDPEHKLFSISQSALKWGAIGWPDNPDNDWDWADAQAYYRAGDKTKAYKALGHVLHLLEDLSVPLHTRLISHVSGPENRFETYFAELAAHSANSLPLEYWQAAETMSASIDIKRQFNDMAGLTFASFTQDGRTVHFNDYYTKGKVLKTPDDSTLESMGRYLFPKAIGSASALMRRFHNALHPALSAQAKGATDAMPATGNQEEADSVPIEEYVPKVIIEGKWGTGPGEFGRQGDVGYDFKPESLAVDSKGSIYILDFVNNRIQKYSSQGTHIKDILIDGLKGPIECWAVRSSDKTSWAVESDSTKPANVPDADLQPYIWPPEAQGINIVIDSKDTLYYYLKRVKDGKETGEVWEFKKDKLVRKSKKDAKDIDDPKNPKAVPFSQHPARNWIHADIKQEANENFTATEKEGKRVLKIKLRANEKLPGYAIYDKQQKLWKIGVKAKGKFWHYIYNEAEKLSKISEVPELSEFADSRGNYYYLETGTNGLAIRKSELVAKP